MNEISDVMERLFIDCCLEDPKADGSNIAYMFRVGIAQLLGYGG